MPSAAGRRRLIFFWLCLVWVTVAAIPMIGWLQQDGWTFLDGVTFLLFLVLMSQVAFGFTLALVGFVLLWRGGDPVSINRTLPKDAPAGDLPATAIVMPIFNEDVGRVFQALEVMDESLRRLEGNKAFDFFVLSDSTDPDCWVAEELAWLELCRRRRGFGRIFYRHRRVKLHNKSGNIADFCRRWGANYRYMIVLDADSIMEGQIFIRLVQLMEQNPQSGIIQTYPQAVLGQTLFQRIQQFAGRVYGPIFMAGANYWQRGSSGYWGHNAIIRLKPFIEHCAMPELPHSVALGTRILSHDTIEAALMRRAGYGVWFAYDLKGSYEEAPPHLHASLERDRRWCRGNLQHVWFLFSRGVKAASRVQILNGIMAYASSPLWLAFLLLGTANAMIGGLPFHRAAPVWLFICVMALLLLPKILGLTLFFKSVDVATLGGRGKVILSALAEMVFSVLLAPILMLFYTRIVFACLSGIVVRWGKQMRKATAPTWSNAFRAHLLNTLFVLGWAGLLAWTAPEFLVWLSLVIIGPLLAIPFARLTGRKLWGNRARDAGWFLVPEETSPPDVLQAFEKGGDFAEDTNEQFVRVVVDPFCNALHVSIARNSGRSRMHDYLNALGTKLLKNGVESLSATEKGRLLTDADVMRSLHRKLWCSRESELHASWRHCLRHFQRNTETAKQLV